MAERDLIEPAGLPDRPWYRHVIYAPGLYTGYGVKTIPGVREAVDAGNYTRAAEQAQTSSIRALQRATKRAGRPIVADRSGKAPGSRFCGSASASSSSSKGSARSAGSPTRRCWRGQLAGWAQAVPAGVVEPPRISSAWRCPIRRTSRGWCRSARSSSGAALIAGFWTPFFAFVAFFMALNFQFASGALFKYSVLTSGYGLPVLGVYAGAGVGRGAAAVEHSRLQAPARAMKARSS